MSNNTTPGSILIGILTFGLMGFSVYSGLVRLEVLAGGHTLMIPFIGVGVLLGLFLGIKYPIFTEASSFAVTALIMVQGTWDIIWDIRDGVGDGRVWAAGIALSIFVLNIFTGKLKRGTAKNQMRRTIGTR